MENILEIRSLSKDYGSFKLDNISFDVPRGSIMGLIGENGAGKTTIIKLILNLIKKDSGEIRIFGEEASEKVLKDRIGVVLDESSFYESFSPQDIEKVMANIYDRWDSEAYRSYIEKFGLPEKKRVKEFSRGMKMRLALSVALSHNAELLILDEAMSGLDPVARNDIMDVFFEFIQNEKCSILISSHITGDLEKISDYITFIHKGGLLLTESKDELMGEYGIIRCGSEDFVRIEKSDIVAALKSAFNHSILVKDKEKIRKKYPGLAIDTADLEDIMLFYVRGEKQ